MEKILILAANPRNTGSLRLDEELRDIVEGLRRAQYRDKFSLTNRFATRPRDIQRAMLEEQPQIVHFSGHGEGVEGLVFEDDNGQAKLVSGEALAQLFALFANSKEFPNPIYCVVLNGCYSKCQAEAIAQHVTYVVGMSKAIGDSAAIDFSVGFYDAIGAGRNIEFAFDLGCSAISLGGNSGANIPILIQKKALNSLESSSIKVGHQEKELETQQHKASNTGNEEPVSSQTQETNNYLNKKDFFDISISLIIGTIIIGLIAFIGSSIHDQGNTLVPLRSSNDDTNDNTDSNPAESEDSQDYSKLNSLLESKNWQEADIETTHIILDSQNRQNKDKKYIEPGTSSCLLLSKINEIWESHSQNRFGFKMQRKTYLNILENNKSDFLDPFLWQEMSRELGWMQDNVWIPYGELVFNKDAPDGHLPADVFRQGYQIEWASPLLLEDFLARCSF